MGKRATKPTPAPLCVHERNANGRRCVECEAIETLAAPGMVDELPAYAQTWLDERGPDDAMGVDEAFFAYGIVALGRRVAELEVMRARALVAANMLEAP